MNSWDFGFDLGPWGWVVNCISGVLWWLYDHGAHYFLYGMTALLSLMLFVLIWSKHHGEDSWPPFVIWTIVLLSSTVGVLRGSVPGHGLSYAGAYEAFAHIWVGMLIGFIFIPKVRGVAIGALLIVTAVEAVAFFLR